MRIRNARPDDLAVLVDIERATGRMFLALDADLFADHDPGSVEELTPYADSGRAFVSVDADDSAVGYLLVDPVDGAAHIEQVSVHPDHARKGLGRALIEHAASWARARDLDSLTLTTYVDVPWNRPYYERLGFRRLTTDEETPGLRAIREHERAIGLEVWPRTGMRLSLSAD
jgi:ribosomal protein S18 acetylase RimI-like enzyme